MNTDPILRPLERRVLRLVEEGIDEVEIARRFRRSPEMIRRIIVMTRLPRTRVADAPRGTALRPLERRVLRWRDRGAPYAEIGPRFRRTPAFTARVELLARYKLEHASSERQKP
jgi:DNA-binding CsgD family transcriptional regulator